MKIQKYIKDKQNKYKVVIDDEEYILYDDVIIKYNLLMKNEVSKEIFKELNNYNNELSSYYDSIKYISKKLRSEKEIYEYLKKKDISPNIIQKTIKKLKDNHFLNDEVFVKCYLNDQINLSQNGPLKIKNNLLKLGIDNTLIDNKMANISPDVWNDKLNNYLEKKLKVNTKSSEYHLKSKIKLDLINLGYDKSMVDDLLSKVTYDDSKIREKEYEKIKASLEKKYSGYELEMKIKEKMYRKGFKVNDYER